MNLQSKTITNFLVVAVALLSFPVILSDKGRAGQLSSPWVIDQYTKSRLFVGGYDKERKILRLGWHVSLQEGWKTYWRSPGEAGLPPRWSWATHQNISRIEVNWPLPEKMNIFDMDTYIYHDEVILPIELSVIDEGKPVSLSLDLEYMICEEICIPLEGQYELTIPSLDRLKVSLFQEALLNKYSETVPQKVSAEHVTITKAEQKNTLLVELPEQYETIERIIVEGPEGIMFHQPQEIKGQDKKRFQVSYFGEAKNLSGRELTLTLIAAQGNAYEMTVPLL